MELLWLKYFQELAHSEHLSKTAEKLHIAQPSLSQTLKRLEAELGVPLFDRTGRRIVLNSYGKIVLKYTEQIFGALDNLHLELQTELQSENRTVALYIRAASMLLPGLVDQIQKADPQIRLRIFQQDTEKENKEPFLSVTASHICPQNDHTILLLKEPILAALPKNHPLALRPVLTLQDLEKEDFLSLTPSSDLAGIIRHYCEEAGFRPHITTCVDTPATMRALLQMNLGVAFVPERTWKDFASDTVQLRPVTDLPMKRYLLLAWGENRYQTSAFRLCKSIIIHYFRGYNWQFQGEEEESEC